MPKATKEKPEKKDSKGKDPNAPKKPLGAYMWFCKDVRGTVKAENPAMTVTDIGKRLGELWKEVDPKEKQKYLDRAEADKDRYNREQALYNKGKERDRQKAERAEKAGGRGGKGTQTEVLFPRDDS